MAQLSKGTTYIANDTVTHTNLNALVDSATLQAGAISEQTEITTTATTDRVLVWDATDSGLKQATLANLMPDLGIATAKYADLSVTAGKLAATLDLSGKTAVTLPADAVGDTQLNYANASISALAIDWSAGYAFYKTLTANDTFTFSNNENGKTITVMLTASGGARTPAFPATVEWANGTGPAAITSGKRALYVFSQVAGVVLGSFTNNYATA